MIDYDGHLFNARQGASKALLNLSKAEANCDAVNFMSTTLDGLNKAWDELTDCLNRRIKERDWEIKRLLNELAESKDRHE